MYLLSLRLLLTYQAARSFPDHRYELLAETRQTLTHSVRHWLFRANINHLIR